MASKRKRDADDESLSSPVAKQMKEEEVTRSGRVRKKPSKFKEDGKGADVKNRSQTDTGSIPMSVQEVLVDTEPEPELMMHEELVTPAKTELSLSADEDYGKSGGGRAGRARKKSAKVLEMEEFEEAERKSLKKDGTKKGATGTPGANLLKKIPKSPTSPVLLITSPQATPKVKPTSIPINTSPISTQISPPKKNTSPKSPISLTAQIAPSEGKASVIKLLLSSPSQAASSIISSTAVSPMSQTQEKLQTSTKKKGKSKEKPVQELVVTSPVGVKSQVKQMLQMPKPALAIKTEIVSHEEVAENVLLKMDNKETPVKVEKVKVAKEPKIKKEKKSPKELPVISSSSLPSPNVIHVGSMSLAGGADVKAEMDMISSKKNKKSKVKVEREEEAMISDEYELEVPDIELGEPGEDSFMKMDEDSLEIPSEEFDLKPKAAKKKKMGKEKVEKQAVVETIPEMPSADLVMDFSRMKSAEKKKKKTVKELVEDLEKSKKKRAPTAYTLWCNTNRPKVVEDNPGIDFSTISKTLGEMWSSLPDKEKMLWKRRAKKAAGKGSTLITTGKAALPKAHAPQIIPVSKPSKDALQRIAVVQAAPTTMLGKQQKVVIDDVNVPLKGFGKEPVDVAAHLKIVGESLSIIGMKLQEHRGLIAVQGSLSVLLDSMLCAVAPLMCLTSILPETDGLPEHIHMKNLDNIAYIMPGL